MNNPSSRCRTYAELARISNLPTTITNVLVGCAIGTAGVATTTFPWLKVGGAWLAVACFYVAGMAMNDVVDASIDAVERPGRPIPSGRISHQSASIFVAILFGIGLATLGVLGLPALACGATLVAIIIAYNLTHTKFGGSVVLMGCCRGMTYVVAAAAMTWPLDWKILSIFAGAISLYTVLFTIIARRENQTDIGSRRMLAAFVPIVAAAPILAVRPTVWGFTILALMVMLFWMSRATRFVSRTPPLTRNAVMIWIAGFCLVDAMYLTALEQPFMALASVAAFALTVLAHRRILGT